MQAGFTACIRAQQRCDGIKSQLTVQADSRCCSATQMVAQKQALLSALPPGDPLAAASQMQAQATLDKQVSSTPKCACRFSNMFGL